MTVTWTDLEGSLLGAVRLHTMLRGDSDGADFSGTTEADGKPCWIKVSFRQQELAPVRHPSLVQIRETGKSEWDGMPVTYVAMEMPDEDLSGVLEDRPLSVEETRQALKAVVPALAYLHNRGQVHGAIAPSRIVAIGDRIKLTSDSIREGAGEAPEDMRALGVCTYTMLTQRAQPDLTNLGTLAPPFRDIVRGCLDPDPKERWTAERVALALDLPPATPRPVVPEKTSTWNPVWTYLIVGTALAGLGIFLSHKPQRPLPPPVAPPTTVSRPVVTPAPRPSPLGSPTTPPPSSADPRIWRVVAYTYSRADDATRMVASINQKWPQLKAELFSPRGSENVKYVAIGGPMTRTDALRMQQKARDMGLPPDTFARNFKP